MLIDNTNQSKDYIGISLDEGMNMDSGAERPNRATQAAMREAETSDALEALDMRDFRKFVVAL